MSKENEELVWVDKELAVKYNELKKDKTKRDERIKVFEDYIEKISETSRLEFKAQLEGLEEDAQMYTGLMLKVKKAFETAKNEQLTASYELWEKFEAELPSTKKKIDKITAIIKPLEDRIGILNKELNKINTFDIERVTEAIRVLAGLSGERKDMVEFLIKKFKK